MIEQPAVYKGNYKGKDGKKDHGKDCAINAINRKRNWQKQWGCRASVVVVLLLILTLTWARLIRWQTFISPVTAQSNLAVSFAYPSDWQPHVTTLTAAFVVIDVTPQPPQGGRRWINEHLLHQDYSHWNTGHVTVELFVRPSGTDLASQETDLQKSLTLYCARHGKTCVLQHSRHSLGPDLQVILQSPARSEIPTMLSHNHFIFVNSIPHTNAANLKNENAEICVFCTGTESFSHQLQPTMEQLVRSIQILKQ